MNPRRGHEKQDHRDAKPAIARPFNTPFWSVYYEQRDADIVVMHNATKFVAAIEAESSPRNVLRNLERDMANGCDAVAIVSLTGRYLNQIKNKVQKYTEPHEGSPIKVFPFSEIGLLKLRDWIEQLAQSHGENNGETR